MRGTYRIGKLLRALHLAYLKSRAIRAVRRFPTVASRRPHRLPHPLIVTLTSYPARYPTLAMTLKSLLDQDVIPDRTILWIAENDIRGLPEDVRGLQPYGLEIRPCRDLRSYKKLIPALENLPDAFLVTADDDVYYPSNWLSGLEQGSLLAPGQVISWRAHRAHRCADGRTARYADWELATAKVRIEEADASLFPTGVGGVLYPPHSLHPDVLDQDSFMRLCPNGDDIWFYWMARRAKTLQARVAGRIDLIEWSNTQAVGLRVANFEGDGNDRQIQAMETVYGPFPF